MVSTLEQSPLLLVYVTYEFKASWSLVAGCQQTLLFYCSDFLGAGYYAYHWIRPPTEINIPIDTSETLMLNYFGSLDDWGNQFTVIAGTVEVISPNVGPLVPKTPWVWSPKRRSVDDTVKVVAQF